MKYIISLLILTYICVAAIPDDEHETLVAGSHLVLSEKFYQADSLYNSLITKYPDHPLGYFGMASLYSAMMVHYETDRYNQKIKKLYEKSIDLSEKKLEDDEDNKWLLYFIGSAKSNTSFLLGREKKYFSALTKAYSGISYIEDCLEIDPDFHEAKMVYGSYLYYKSNYLGFFSDNREEGLNMVKDVIENSDVARYFALSAITWIYIDYEKYNDAITYADIALKKYPDSRYFTFGKARALFEKKKYSEAIDYYKDINEKLENDTVQTFYDNVNSCYLISQCYYNLKDTSSTLKYARKALGYKLTEETKDRLEDKLDDLEDLIEDLEE